MNTLYTHLSGALREVSILPLWVWFVGGIVCAAIAAGAFFSAMSPDAEQSGSGHRDLATGWISVVAAVVFLIFGLVRL